jgi:radical SAM protein with 4Fe4S-binding SPASM domain
MNAEWLKRNAIYRYEWRDGKVIFYSPIARRYAIATDEQFDAFLSEGLYADVFSQLAEYVPINQQQRVRRPEHYTLLTVLPNNTCNFSCAYCYSALGRNKSQLSIEVLKTAIDFFIDTKPDSFNRNLTISFMGGGEPMLSWDCVRQGTLFAREKADSRGLKLNLRIITNGSILNDDIIDFIVKNKIEVSVSYEIIPEIQDLQRKNHKLVFENIIRMLNANIPLQFNSTITPSNVLRMEEMIGRIHTEFPAVRNAMFEPVVSQEMFPTPADMRCFYEQFIEHFCSSLHLADKNGIALTSFAYLRTVFPLERACPGEFCLTADGDITGCYCVATSQQPLFPQVKYGQIKDGLIHFYYDRFQKLLSADVYSRPECEDCKVKWNCGGGCFHQYNTYEKCYQEEVCFFTMEFVKKIVSYKVDKFMQIKFGHTVLDKPIVINEMI